MSSGMNDKASNNTSDTLNRLAAIIEGRKPANGGDPATSYVARLFAKGDDAILKKIGEEATETVMAAKDVRVDGDSAKLLYECADLWFHSLIMLAQFDLKPDDVLAELARREGLSGLEEKANRKLEQREQDERRD
ncbi:phosphoribosyl-ATP diphosphatase [Herbaspirillum sp. RTI4]|uniref:phosphoribosyl-ATP diphosphatase n=1 Tax=Herbaspirillum sp. RTI4 TaxID=3048640 RepID=UPI002AB53E58|nr:phosphoribosyl-ATP diphosphatase [Herbaspirillum sp. RTI4]MDY7577755.1 phosphoribosyl-ATP diphosphatase [Herbaspirillum sp. RTI4]MEA9980817.1 phosphoribosyl-ATP diphosphatase [Herbaspirillum sp. RTI4]